MTRYLSPGGPYQVAHRGGAGLGRENVLETFIRSFEAGAQYLETDVRITADGECLAFHDAGLARITGFRGRVADLTLAQIHRLGHGAAAIPRIEELLSALPDARFSMDLKDSWSLGPLVELLRRRGDLDRVELAGTRDRWLSAARKLAGPALATALGWESTSRLVLGARAGRVPHGLPPAEFVHVPLRLGRLPVFTERLVAMAHDLGLRVVVWTVDDPSTMRRLLDQGVDGIITDYPDLLHAVVAERSGCPADCVAGCSVPVANPAMELRDPNADQLVRAFGSG